MSIKDESGQFLMGFCGLFIFGLVYNQLVGWMNRRGFSEGYTAIQVVFGTAVTVAFALPLIGLRSVAIIFGFFTASGLPMVIGDIYRYAMRRNGFEKRLHDHVAG